MSLSPGCVTLQRFFPQGKGWCYSNFFERKGGYTSPESLFLEGEWIYVILSMEEYLLYSGSFPNLWSSYTSIVYLFLGVK